jgi:glycosyltransferase involved in cell wall biosynthesis
VREARLAVVGTGPLEQGLRELARRLGVADRVRWLGERDARGVMAGFDVFAISSRKEGLPYVVLEAMAAGLPVVATASAGVEILVRADENGVVVPRGDVAGFARGLIGLGLDRGRLAEFGAASRARAGRFTIDEMVGRTLAAYHEAVGRKARRAAAAAAAPAAEGSGGRFGRMTDAAAALERAASARPDMGEISGEAATA